jgi:hypothetical protein
MYKKLVQLNPAEHSALRLKRRTSYDYAKQQLVAPIIVDELSRVAREYPIVFPVGSNMPVALLGVEQNKNDYVDETGAWRAQYIPAHIRHYPFAMVPIDTKEEGKTNSLAVLVDLESPLVGDKEGELIFEAENKMSARALRRVRLMQQIHDRAGLTQSLVKAIEDAGLLQEIDVRIRRESQDELQVTGLRMINEVALNKLDDEAFNRLRKSGALPLVYAALLSMASLRSSPASTS